MNKTTQIRMEQAIGLLQGLAGEMLVRDHDFASLLQDTATAIHDRLGDGSWTAEVGLDRQKGRCRRDAADEDRYSLTLVVPKAADIAKLQRRFLGTPDDEGEPDEPELKATARRLHWQAAGSDGLELRRALAEQGMYCDNPSVKEVPVSVEEVGDQARRLCASCEEAYTWGVQHGRMVEAAGEPGVLTAVASFLHGRGFIVLGENGEDPSPGRPVEAWAYAGPLDFAEACPVTSGLGRDCMDALRALAAQLATAGNDADGPADQRCP